MAVVFALSQAAVLLLFSATNVHAWSLVAPLHSGVSLHRCSLVAPLHPATARLERAALLMAETEEPMPDQLVDWGCDAALWNQIRGAKGSLRKLAREGDEQQARKRIESIRRIVADEANGVVKPKETQPPMSLQSLASTTSPSTGAAAPPKKGAKIETNKNKKKPLKDGYTFGKGTLRPDMDRALIESIVEARFEAKMNREYELADSLQSKLTSMGIRMDDIQRTWNVAYEESK